MQRKKNLKQKCYIDKVNYFKAYYVIKCEGVGWCFPSNEMTGLNFNKILSHFVVELCVEKKEKNDTFLDEGYSIFLSFYFESVDITADRPHILHRSPSIKKIDPPHVCVRSSTMSA